MHEDSWPDNELELLKYCPVCGSRERELLHTGLRDRVFGVAPGDWTLHRCLECQSAYLDPRPTLATIGQAYTNYYTHQTNDHPIVRRIAAANQPPMVMECGWVLRLSEAADGCSCDNFCLHTRSCSSVHYTGLSALRT